MKNIVLSSLGHTWILDLDGTLVEHNKYKEIEGDTILEHTKNFVLQIPSTDMIIIVTSRSEEYRKITEEFLKIHGIRYNTIIFNAPYGERIIINDRKPSGLDMAKAINVDRNSGLNFNIIINEQL